MTEREGIMKKIVCAMLGILLVFSLLACGKNDNEVTTHHVESEMYLLPFFCR